MRRTCFSIALALLGAPAAAAPGMVGVGGRVTGAAGGKDLGGVTVVAIDRNGTERSVRTDRQGRFGVRGLAPGLVVISVQDSIYQGYTRACRVPAGYDAIVDFAISKHAHGPATESGCRIVRRK